MKKKHYRVGGNATCACGFSAYSVSGIMLDYGEVLRWHIEAANKRDEEESRDAAKNALRPDSV